MMKLKDFDNNYILLIEKYNDLCKFHLVKSWEAMQEFDDFIVGYIRKHNLPKELHMQLWTVVSSALANRPWPQELQDLETQMMRCSEHCSNAMREVQ